MSTGIGTGRLWTASRRPYIGGATERAAEGCRMESWADRHAALARLAERQLFFVDGQPRSGTTWLQQMLDSHPDVSCRGEAQFRDHLAVPLDRAMRQRFAALHERNTSIFGHTGGYPLPDPGDTQFLLGTAILSAFRQQMAGRAVQAVGEKTPGNLFFFPQLRALFPQARLIGIVRDPRDVISSNWHRFQDRPGATDADKIAFIRKVLPMAVQWMRAMLDAREQFPEHFRLVSYETLHRAPEPALATLFRFLGVSDHAEIVADCVARNSFARLAGRPAGTAENGTFFRKGMPGDWPNTLTPEMGGIVLQALGWSFPEFGWQA